MSKMKNKLTGSFGTHASFVMRNPLLPIDVFFNWKAAPELPVAKSREVLRQLLHEFFLQPIIQEALYIASPDLYERLLLWRENKIGDNEKKDRTELALVKYMIRICSRCTPYGLFASCTSGSVSQSTTIQLEDKSTLQRFARLDMDYVCELHNHLLGQRKFSKQLVFFPNTSLYRAGFQWRYVEHRYNKEKGRSYHLVEIDHSSHLEKIVTAAKHGLKPDELAAIITGNGVSAAEAIEFVYELVESQVLVDELKPSITGEEFFSVFLRKLKTLDHTRKYIESLEKTAELFNQLEQGNPSDKPSIYQQVARELRLLDIEVHLKTLIQLDSYRPAITSAINKKINDEVLKGIELLRLLSVNESTGDPFADFKSDFIKRYEQEWMPLAEVLDTESGIGYGKFIPGEMEPSPLIDELPRGIGLTDAHAMPIHDLAFKWQLYEEAISMNKTEVHIDEALIHQMTKNTGIDDSLPDSLCAMVKLRAAASSDIDKGNYTFTLESVSGPPGATLLGRFSRLHPDIEKLILTILKEEESHHADALFAEIVHLPESRTGNILMRPVLRKYEIPYLCGSAVKHDFQIPVTDLLVGVVANKVVLRSRRLNKQVIPRMTTAHNFSLTSLPVYQFLCDLQYQDTHRLEWQWGVLSNRPFLPRVCHRRFILSKARWLLTQDDVKVKKNDEELLHELAVLRAKKNIPEYVALVQGDSELFLHLKNIFCARILLSEITKAGTVLLTEVLDTPGQCWVQSPDGRHSAEFIMAFSKKQEEIKHFPVSTARAAGKNVGGTYLVKPGVPIQRNFPVGSEWLYAKIYCGTKTTENLLCNVLKPFVETLFSKQLIDKFFFVRYTDDEGPHLRIRFHNALNKDFWKDVIFLLQQTLQPHMNTRTIHNLRFETYKRETERYGEETMELSEDIFGFHSNAIMNFICLLEGDQGEELRWQVALKAIDLVLDDFSYNLGQKSNLIKTLDKNFSHEFKIGSAGRKIISARYSEYKQLIDVLMSEAWQQNERLAEAIRIFNLEDQNYKATVERIMNTSSMKSNRVQLDKLMQSFLHLFINRLFVSNQRKTEMVIYAYLLKYYESKLAREKTKSAVPELVNNGQ